MTVYECGHWGDDDECPHCGADVRDEQPKTYETVAITCEGWKND